MAYALAIVYALLACEAYGSFNVDMADPGPVPTAIREFRKREFSIGSGMFNGLSASSLVLVDLRGPRFRWSSLLHLDSASALNYLLSALVSGVRPVSPQPCPFQQRAACRYPDSA